MILGTHRKTSNWRSRIAAAVMIIGAATLSAPLIQADAHPEKQLAEEELAGKHESKTSKSIIKRMIEVDGKKSSVSFEVIVEGDEVKAFRVEPSGKKSRVDIKDIDGGIFSFGSSEDYSGEKHQLLKLGKGKNSFFYAPSENSEGDVEILSDEITVFNTPKPPMPPGVSSRAQGVIVFESDDLEGLEGLSALKKLEVLKSLDGLDGLDAMDNDKSFIVFSEGGEDMTIEMRVTESRLAAARQILERTSKDLRDDSREMVKAKRELEKARKALKAAEKALKEAE